MKIWILLAFAFLVCAHLTACNQNIEQMQPTDNQCQETFWDETTSPSTVDEESSHGTTLSPSTEPIEVTLAPEQMNLYEAIVDTLDGYVDNGNIEIDGLVGQQALSYCYEQLSNMGDYIKSRSMLDRFTVVEDCLLSFSIEPDSTIYFGYDKEGKLNLISERVDSTYYVLDNVFYTGYMTIDTFPFYDSEGNIITLTQGEGLVIDEGGRLIGERAKGYIEDYDILYTYDDSGRLINKAAMNYGQSVASYTYNEDNLLAQQMIQQSFSDVSTSEFVVDCLYDDGNKLSGLVYTRKLLSKDFGIIYSQTTELFFERDFHGKIKGATYRQESWSEYSEDNSSTEKQGNCELVYGDFYIFDSVVH